MSVVCSMCTSQVVWVDDSSVSGKHSCNSRDIYLYPVRLCGFRLTCHNVNRGYCLSPDTVLQRIHFYDAEA